MARTRTPCKAYISRVPLGMLSMGWRGNYGPLKGSSCGRCLAALGVCVRGCRVELELWDGSDHAHATTCVVCTAQNVVQEAPNARVIRRERGHMLSGVQGFGGGGGPVLPHRKRAALAPHISTTKGNHAMIRTSLETWFSWLHGSCRRLCIRCMAGELRPLIGSSVPPAHKGCNSTS